MKIFYAIQATGNGHISRAMELLPYLQQYGKVDIFLSGANSSLRLDAPVKYRSRGLSLFYTCKGSLDYFSMVKNISPLQIKKEVAALPVEKYDLVINDFECITSLACRQKKVPSIHFGHQASFMSAKTPRPRRQSRTGEWILKKYAGATQYMGLHFRQYDDFILTPVIKSEIWNARSRNDNYITVYLPSYCDCEIRKFFGKLTAYRFQVFSREVKVQTKQGHLTFIPVSKERFNESLIHCAAIVCGAGFETPSEALHLKKKIMVMPIKGQYEQQCNAAALEQLGVRTLTRLTDDFNIIFEKWYAGALPVDISFEYNAGQITALMMQKADACL
ncbi:glycosyltransferase family protein [Agriterribacter sp.]|uniref:glycosyltransferase family protein n=1 Tax=Agriterribacter sp. TaxID=2821509 RepID=UPI002D1673EB|nr:glycosyltransferase family protein [Agriterribacter sp.]HRP55202.1 glycosyltransferase family protein [Agriterribacter sp.]